MTEYAYMDFDEQETDWNGLNDKIIEDCLQNLLDNCDFIVTEGGAMYSRDSISGVGNNLRGPCLMFDGFLYTQFYRVRGGYRRLK